MAYVPVDDDTAVALLGEGVHTGLRKGTDAPGAHAAWVAIDKTDGWQDALAYAVEGLRSMGYAVCKEEEEEEDR